ncbi:hypothetical protein JXR93_10055 [bacterium]|nr:hypothetical protein [bacterium]
MNTHNNKTLKIYSIFIIPLSIIILAIFFAKNSTQQKIIVFEGESTILPIGKISFKESNNETLFFLNGEIQQKLNKNIIIDKKERVDTASISLKIRENNRFKNKPFSKFNDSIIDIYPMGILNYENFDSSETKIVMTDYSKNYKNLGEAREISYSYPNSKKLYKQWIFKNYPKYNLSISKEDPLSITWESNNYITKYYIRFINKTLWGVWGRFILFITLSLSILIFFQIKKSL